MNIHLDLQLTLPRAYGGCSCACHKHGGVFHVMPCCFPITETLVRPDIVGGLELFSRRRWGETSEELAPCDRCGHDAAFRDNGWQGHDHFSVSVECSNTSCGLRIPSHYKTRADAAKAWNRTVLLTVNQMTVADLATLQLSADALADLLPATARRLIQLIGRLNAQGWSASGKVSVHVRPREHTVPAFTPAIWKTPLTVERLTNKAHLVDADNVRVATVLYSNYDYDNKGALCDARAEALRDAVNATNGEKS